VRNLIAAAAALLAIAGSASAAKLKLPNGDVRHTWFHVDFAAGKCVTSKATPEQFADWANSAAGHDLGMSADRISPDDVAHSYGDLAVTVHLTRNGIRQEARFFTSKEDCDLFVENERITPQQAPSGDIN